MQSSNVRYLSRLDQLRFLAAVSVLMFHSAGSARLGAKAHDLFPIPLIDEGHTGVMLFMVISGFILSTIAGDRTIVAGKFYLNRILRIYPLYIFVVAYGYFSTFDGKSPSAGIDMIMALLPISNLYSAYGAYGGQFWSVAIELQFYLIFPFLLMFKRTNGQRYLIGLIGMLLVFRAARFQLYGSVHGMSYMTIFGDLDLFLIGMLAADYYRAIDDGIRRWWYAAWVIPASFLAINLMLYLLFGFRGFFHVDRWGISTDPTGTSHSWIWIIWPTLQALVWAGFLLAFLKSELPILLGSLWAALGRISYSMYAWHLFVIQVLPAHKFTALSPYAFGLLIVLPVTAALSWMTYQMIELPFLSLRVRYIRDEPAEIKAAPVSVLPKPVKESSAARPASVQPQAP